MIYLGWLCSIGSRIVYEFDHRKPILYVIPVESILGKLTNYLQYTETRDTETRDTETIPHRLRNHFSWTVRPATACLVPAMDAGCGLSIRGHWDGPVMCNEAGRAGWSRDV